MRRRNLILIFGVPALAVAAAFLIAPMIQPEQFADATSCLADMPDGAVMNTCPKPIIAAFCSQPEGDSVSCSNLTIGQGGSVAPPEVPAETPAFRFACEAPYVPDRVANTGLNASQKINSCVRPG